MRMTPLFFALLLLMIHINCTQEGLVYEIDLEGEPFPLVEAFFDVKSKAFKIKAMTLESLYDVQTFQDYQNYFLDSTYSFALSSQKNEMLEIPPAYDHKYNYYLHTLRPGTPFNYYRDIYNPEIQISDTLTLKLSHPHFGEFEIMSENLPLNVDTIMLEEFEHEILDWIYNSTLPDTSFSYGIQASSLPSKFYIEVFYTTMAQLNDSTTAETIIPIKTNNPFLDKRRIHPEGNYHSFLFTEKELFFFGEQTKFYTFSFAASDHHKLSFHVRLISENMHKYLKSIYNQPILPIEQEMFVEPSEIYSQIPNGIGCFGVFKEFVFRLN